MKEIIVANTQCFQTSIPTPNSQLPTPYHKLPSPYSLLPTPFVVLLVLLALTPALLSAQEDEGVTASTDLILSLSTVPEAKLGLSQSFTFPFLRGSSPLTSDNNINTVITAEVSPLTLDGIGEVNWTPAAFFVLSGGAMAGSGWSTSLGDGIGLNKPIDVSAGKPRKASIEGKAFGGLVWAGWGAGTLQFDLGAVIPGDWTHVLFQIHQEFRYSAYTGAGSGEPWVFENDEAENQNGWKYRAAYVLGYSLPRSPVFDMIAFAAELEKPLYRTPGGDFWGESLGHWEFSALFNFSINPRFSTALAIQLQTHRNHGTSNFGNRDYYYQDFELLDEGGQRRILFHRVALIFNYKIR